ncbi:MAG: ATP-dependent DNA helicase PcrA [Ruminococcaceae bacterium]|nr:ATP-dependent DNA helicase PcrA [Oscillospiraceae bacterium]
MTHSKIIELRKKIIEKDFSRVNKEQFKAITSVNGPLLILAGAGSGKTTVIVNRIACMLRYGNAYNSSFVDEWTSEQDVDAMQRYLDGDTGAYDDVARLLRVDAPKPWQILAITFTNKAAGELKERLQKMLGDDAGNDIWASTFHSACVRILRRECEKIGYTSHYTIYDTDDSKRVIKDCQQHFGIDDKHLPVKAILNMISRAKDSLIDAEEFAKNAGGDVRAQQVAKVYARYQQQLQAADAMDFDDIIVNTVRLLENNPDTLDYYRNRFKYILVDEYQDTNHAQYRLVSLLAGGHHNLCVVGDDDQSIYRFRGATIENILSFEEQFADTTVIRLEQNYRSTPSILAAANAVIQNNTERKGKNLWTSRPDKDKIILKTCDSDILEGIFVADTIVNNSSDGYSFSDQAVLYRMNAQSNNVERALVKAGIPYRIIGGHRFYDRKEIKDALAYLAVISNPADTVRLRRIINEPKRGIGETTVTRAIDFAGRLGISVFEVMRTADEFADLARSAKKLNEFCNMIDRFRALRATEPASQLFRIVMNETGYIQSLAADPATMEERCANLDELFANMVRFEEENGENATLEGFLEEVSLLTDIDNYNADLDTVTLMTMHAAKGLEFPCVYIVGMENGIFPGMQSMINEADMEEERRLAYVGITRAKDRLYLLNAASRMLYGKTTSNPPSQFLKEIPTNLIEDRTEKRRSPYGASVSYGSTSSGYTGSGNYNSGYSQPRRERYADIPDDDRNYHPQKKAVNYGFSGMGSSSAQNNTPAPDFKAGDAVRHKKFGDGFILTATALGNDQLLEVAFDSCGTKKLMAKAAKLEKI